MAASVSIVLKKGQSQWPTPFIMFGIGTTPTVSSYFLLSLEVHVLLSVGLTLGTGNHSCTTRECNLSGHPDTMSVCPRGGKQQGQVDSRHQEVGELLWSADWLKWELRESLLVPPHQES